MSSIISSISPDSNIKASDLDGLRRMIYQKVPHYLFVCPLIASLTWFTTLAVLLIYWLASGRPTYPNQSNPYVAFISDIAAFHLKPFFILGCTVTSVSLIATGASLHYARYSTRFLHHAAIATRRHRKIISLSSLLTSTVAGISLFLISLFDTVRAHTQHLILLLSTFGGLGVTIICIVIVWGDLAWQDLGRGTDVQRNSLRLWSSINIALTLLQVLLSVVFIVFLTRGLMKPAGVLEWTITFMGSFWLLNLAAMLRAARNHDYDNRDNSDSEHENEDERRPLLPG